MDQLIDKRHPVTVCKASAGTGKTYTLAAYYIALLLSEEDYRSILAITFTNKATAEMSERILTSLYAISQGCEEEDFVNLVRSFMLRDAHMPDSVMADRAKLCFRRMLADYDNMHVMTIDAFLQTLLNGLASIVHTSAGTSTELDIDHVVKIAVDQLVTTDLTDENLRIIERYSHFKLTQDTSWDIRSSLRGLAKMLYDEKAQILDAKEAILFSADKIAERREMIEQQWKTHPDVVRLREIVAALDGMDLSMTNGIRIKQGVENIRKSLDNPKSVKDRFRGMTDNYWSDMMAGNWKKVPQAAIDLADEGTRLIRGLRTTYNTIQLTIEMSRDLELMASLQHIIQRNLAEANSALLARTASILSDALKEGDADFILEKAGIRYRHVLMDEFQDTSRLQWDVIERLLMDVLASEGHTLLIVGDIKQSIYRWRNGDWHIMDDLGLPGNTLTNERINKRFTSLTKNYRSSEEVVKFNLSLFKYIVDHYAEEVENADETEQKLIRRIYDEGFDEAQLDRFYQADKKPGGYVCFRTFEPEERKEETKTKMAMEMFRTMEQLLRDKMQPSDLLILVRSGKTDFPLLTRLHSSLNPTDFPNLTKTPIVSERSFLLEASTAVNVIIAALRLVQDKKDDVAAKQVRMYAEKPDIIEQIHERVTKQTPLYEAVSELVSLLLTDGGRYEGEETAYINCLLDNTREYVHSYGSRMADFLDYWDDTLHEKSIPASTIGAIRMMTIHKSKGLQAQTIFLPFCDWSLDKPSNLLWCPVADELHAGEDYVPISCGDDMADSAYRDAYEEELQCARVDSLNMLYVAVTRAEDNLFIYTDRPVEEHIGKYIADFLGGAEEYEAGKVKIKVKGESGKVKGKSIKPFSFEKTDEVEEAELWANSDQVRFVQSQEGALYTEYGEEAYRRVARMEEGTLCHEIFASIRKADELDAVLDEFMSRGLIKDEEQRANLRTLISSAWQGSPEMRDWFTAPWKLRLEKAIYVNNKEVRPDRVMINPQTNEAIVLDYKFGQWEDEYITQVRGYMNALRELGHNPVRGYLWFARQNKLVPVNYNL